MIYQAKSLAYIATTCAYVFADTGWNFFQLTKIYLWSMFIF